MSQRGTATSSAHKRKRPDEETATPDGATSAIGPSVKPAASAASRCATCRKKVGLLGFRCRCEGTFCSAHRYADKHACGFDYEAAAREQIATKKKNPVVVAASASTVSAAAAASSSTARQEKEAETSSVAVDASSDPAAGMCVDGCGFFGATATDNMCSKCYRDDFDALYAEGLRIVFGPAPAAAASSSTAAPPEKKAKISFPVPASSHDAAAAAAAADNAVTAVNRCVVCGNKVANGTFFRCFATAEMCPKCDREHGAYARIATAAPPEKKPPPAAAAAATNRCAMCRKKVGLLGFRCRCEGTFCSVHRYSDKHACEFNYKAAAREQIAMQNPVVVADKMIDRI